MTAGRRVLLGGASCWAARAQLHGASPPGAPLSVAREYLDTYAR